MAKRKGQKNKMNNISSVVKSTHNIIFQDAFPRSHAVRGNAY